MTNEELAVMIQVGDRSKVPELWEQVRRLASIMAKRLYYALGDDRWGDTDDLMQAAFLGMLDAVERYDQSAEWKFSTVFTNRLKAAFAEATGYQTAAGRNDPLRYADSLDRLIDSTDEEAGTLGDFVADPIDYIEAANERMDSDRRREIVEAVMTKLPAQQAAVLRLRYWHGMTLKETGAALRLSLNATKAAESAALRQLGRCHEIRQLRQHA